MRGLLIGLLVLAGASIPSVARAQATIAENINRYHPGCHARADMRGGDCVAAAHRYCEANHSRNSFGFPIRRDVENIHIACAFRAWYGEVAYGRLQELHPECGGPADAQTPACVAAVRRYCANERSLSGGLIQEVGPGSAAVACFRATRQRDVEYRRLLAISAACNGPGAAGSLSCVTASAEWCRLGNRSELGLPQEVGRDSLAVSCFPARVQVMRVL
ncbi:MAG TPA: hypothetical protein VF746_28150 [Longimicrobium sp.]|jgi:hypothetical protein